MGVEISIQGRHRKVKQHLPCDKGLWHVKCQQKQRRGPATEGMERAPGKARPRRNSRRSRANLTLLICLSCPSGYKEPPQLGGEQM